MAQESKDPQWEGKVIAQLRSATADQVWPFIEDFCSIQKWFPNIVTCRQVKGVYGQPGLVRHNTTLRELPRPDNSDPTTPPETVLRWCYETVVSIDPIKHCLSYQMGENDIGIGFYVAQLKVIDKTKEDGGGCRMELQFTADPMEGQTLEGFLRYIQFSVKTMGERMENALQDSNLK